MGQPLISGHDLGDCVVFTGVHVVSLYISVYQVVIKFVYFSIFQVVSLYISGSTIVYFSVFQVAILYLSVPGQGCGRPDQDEVSGEIQTGDGNLKL